MATYADRIRRFLADGQTRTFDEIVAASAQLNPRYPNALPADKIPYVIGGLKSEITAGRAEKITTAGEKRLWKGHCYRRRQ